jgi:hypothetical protein
MLGRLAESCDSSDLPVLPSIADDREKGWRLGPQIEKVAVANLRQIDPAGRNRGSGCWGRGYFLDWTDDSF